MTDQPGPRVMLTRLADEAKTATEQFRGPVVRIAAAVPVLAAALQAVLDLHREFVLTNPRELTCAEDGALWPCATHRAITRALVGLNPTEGGEQ
jgi:hypothetical protein